MLKQPMLFDGSSELNHSSATKRPSCPNCRRQMLVTRILPAKGEYQHIRFDCLTCPRFEVRVIPVDPLRTDAIGWLASELRPPT
jgi:hypothetical protein